MDGIRRSVAGASGACTPHERGSPQVSPPSVDSLTATCPAWVRKCISSRPPWSKSVRIWICCGFRYRVESQQVKRLHCSTFHNGNTQISLFAVFLGYGDTPQRLRMIVLLPQRVDRIQFLLWGVPSYLVYPWGVLALVFRHSSNGKDFAAKRMG